MATSHDLPIEEVRKLLEADRLSRPHKHKFMPLIFGKLIVYRCPCGVWRDND
jgi:hypothetical protein